MAFRRVAVFVAVVTIVEFGTSSTQQSLQQQPQQEPQQRQQPFCTLGDDVFEVGERWNPNLPPFGVQVCVLCECTIRQRKSCYETKVTCRRVTNECPVIDSCPDGKKPVTVAGQCCKSCQNDTTTAPTTTTTASATTTTTSVPSTNAATTGNSSSLATTEQSITTTQSDNYRSTDPMFTSVSSREIQQPQQWYAQISPTMPTLTTLKLLYLNERTKEYLALVKSLPLCPNRDSIDSGQRSSIQQTSTLAPSPINVKTKGQSGKNELNGIDTRLAFKSLHDSAYPSPAKNRPHSGVRSNTDVSQQQHPHDDLTRNDHQHPNDFQSTIAMTNYQISPTSIDRLPSMHNNRTASGGLTRMCNNRPDINSTIDCDPSPLNYTTTANRGQNYPTRAPNPTNASSHHANTCSLGNDSFQIGDMWNPVLPPFGIQVCVQCNCVIRLRKFCYETRVTCRRINRDCPKIDHCPDGKLPITVAGQCCKTCQAETQSSVGEILQLENVVQRNESVIREYQAISKSMQICVTQREDNFPRVSSKSVVHSQTKRSQRTSS